MIVGVLGLQGDFREHLQALERMGVERRDVRTPEALQEVDALIIPGGESTTLSKLMNMYGLTPVLQKQARKGFPVYGTCAGAILIAKEVEDGKPQGLGLMDITVARNAYGRQLDSFETDLNIKTIGKFHGIFIRAPKITRCGSGTEILAEQDGDPVLVRQGAMLAGTFHPELTHDSRVHEYFLRMIG
ncbi:pyridoxal 5'-phosphate synthase glutaminase subunit PdxT [Candidatus Acetothermia bacterium]|nr:pyridoxal 5'-phosphate synthase glutaminase subunit PdxT [Candidatus Acetothermia bacterium]MBI3643790.1 pyridoxal 5'-phosphate synthase glutaminase subunit PdxT [Candidatus Acetothermia bacterium]